jgi:hypothetical protein
MQAYGARVVLEKGSVAEKVEDRIQLRQSLRSYNYGGSWMNQHIQDQIQNASITQLEILRSIRNGYGDSVKMRIEEPWVQIYAEDIQTLQDIANRFPADLHKNFLSISFPESEEKKCQLEQGKILVKSIDKIGYKYKVILKDGNYSSDVKQSIHDYLTSIGDEVKMSKGTRAMLTNGHNFVWGSFLYVNDPAILTMLALISPGMVGKIHELVDDRN